jgi:integrase
VVVNPAQARALLDAVAAMENGRWLTAFFGCIYYSALRPSEALDLTEDELILPAEAGQWGELHVGRSNPEVTLAWTDSGVRSGRRLKHRAQGAIRIVPAPPQLVELLRQHLDERHIPPGGRLFRGPRGGHLSEDTYSTVWKRAREAALTPREVASPLAQRPYDLRHAAVSTWLAAGVESTQVAAWAGHSVAVLHGVYAHVVAGRGDQSRSLIQRLLES